MLESYVITYVLSIDSRALNSVRLLSHDPRRTAAGYPLQPQRGISASRTGDYERVCEEAGSVECDSLDLVDFDVSQASGDFSGQFERILAPGALGPSSWIRYIRASLAATFLRDFVGAGRARGLSEARLLARHSLPNALFPLVTVLSLDFALLFSGAVVTETVT